uniref:Uncharacterized protein n=1 Tax=Chromera velia CCMP2878 TaxID=1169474 RepID=A0A0G4H6K3_9ALVE|eukprot:Cvel_24824.t1-p1 / transcript=Cvel_24824.t1 / gene=Cvel_24824 / organism=Chromera_velia_CCMP2878 / gene_product=P2X receptor A, putative / transcript_product=P2X receptor A, putative / location=Cvel_scaffold2737:4905-14997(-) / protein_length=650 / sequence_SO=supercontig / SO=protein_coding / is_pseudo=false
MSDHGRDKGAHSHHQVFWRRLSQDLFYYHTAKEVRVRNLALGLVKFALMFLAIFCYVVLFQIVYNNESYERSDVRGVVRMQLQRPTENRCNPSKSDCHADFTPLEALPYCDQYHGGAALNEHGEPVEKGECRYTDEYALNPDDSAGIGTFFIPTRVSFLEQSRDCDELTTGCKNVWVNAKEKSPIQFFADIDRFTLLLDHSFSTKEGEVFHSSFAQLLGFWKTSGCEEGEREHETESVGRDEDEEEEKCELISIPCKGKHCDSKDVGDRWRLGHPLTDLQKKAKKPKTEKSHSKQKWRVQEEASASEKEAAHRRLYETDPLSASFSSSAPSSLEAVETLKESKSGLALPHEVQEWFDPIDAQFYGPTAPSIYQIPVGDIISVRRLLSLAGVDLDKNTNVMKESRRSEGVILTITIKYSNMQPMMMLLGKMPYYIYEVKAESAPGYKNSKTVESVDGKSRTIHDYHGIYIQVLQEGTFGEWSWAELLIVSTSILLISELIVFILDFYMEWCTGTRSGEEFEDIRIDRSRVKTVSCLDDKERIALPHEEDLWKLNGKIDKWAEEIAGTKVTSEDWRRTTLKDEDAEEIEYLIERISNPYNSWREAVAILAAEVSQFKKDVQEKLEIAQDHNTGLTAGLEPQSGYEQVGSSPA